MGKNKIWCYRRAEDAQATIWVLDDCREAMLRGAHGDSVLAGHPGIDRNYAAVSYAYYWPGLFADMVHFVHSCSICAASKSSNKLRMGTAILLQPFTSWAMDLIGPLPVSKKGNTWIVSWVDRTSKTIVASATADSEAIALLTFHKICCRFGLLST